MVGAHGSSSAAGMQSLIQPGIMLCAQEGIYDEFVKAVTKIVGEFKQGGGMDPATTLGPLINPAAVDRVMQRNLQRR